MRLAWHWLERWHEPLSVGAAVALVGLVYLMPAGAGSALSPLSRQPHQPGSAARQHAPADAQYYRDQWIRETAAFYALHPPRRDARPVATSVAPAVTTAKASFTRSQPGNAVTQATHITAEAPVSASTTTPVAQPLSLPPPAVAAGPPEWIKRWRIGASLAAGLLAGLAFVSVWPASATGTASAPATSGDDPDAVGECIAIRLPAAWVGVRPTASQSLRRTILAASYLIASLSGWSLLA